MHERSQSAISMLVFGIALLPVGLILGVFLGVGNLLNGGHYIPIKLAFGLAVIGLGVMTCSFVLGWRAFRLFRRL